MNALEKVEKEIALKNQELLRKPTLKATVQFSLFSKEAKSRFGRRFGLDDPKKDGVLVFTLDVSSHLPKKYWDEKELHEDLYFRIGSILKTIPGLQTYKKGAKPTSFNLNLYGVTLEEGIDFKYEIIRMTEYVYETDEPISWNDIQPIK